MESLQPIKVQFNNSDTTGEDNVSLVELEVIADPMESVDARLMEIDAELCSLSGEIANLTNQATKLDYTVAVASGVIAGLIDIFFVGKFDLQNAVRSIVDAQTSLADAQKMLFENQQKMAAGMRYLLILGASSIAMNRIVIAELQSKLKQASDEELSQAAREELIGVIKLLREQESAFSRQDRMSEQITETAKVVKRQGEDIVGIHEVDKKQDEKDAQHDDLIAKNASKNTEQDGEIQRQKKVDESHDSL